MVNAETSQTCINSPSGRYSNFSHSPVCNNVKNVYNNIDVVSYNDSKSPQKLLKHTLINTSYTLEFCLKGRQRTANMSALQMQACLITIQWQKH